MCRPVRIRPRDLGRAGKRTVADRESSRVGVRCRAAIDFATLSLASRFVDPVTLSQDRPSIAPRNLALGDVRMSAISLIRGVAALALSAAMGASATSVSGATVTGGYGSKVLSFYQGTGLPANYFNNPNSALGAPAPVTGAGTPFPNVLDPFSPAYGKNEIVVIGKTGQITLQLYKAVTVANTPQIGVISNVGLIDSSYPAGKA